MRRRHLFTLGLLVVAALVIRPLPARAAGGLLVVAPHPDDEALMAAGAMLAARSRGEPVDVAVLTNGDFDCRVDGLVREEESVRAMALLGVDESHLHFFGYPDGALSALGRVPLTTRRLEKGRCVSSESTYAAHGAGATDVHTRLHGKPASYTADALVSDLRALIRQLAPGTLIVTHPQDSHPDHAEAYVVVREAVASLPHAPRLLRALVHNGDCWPTGGDDNDHCAPGGIAPETSLPPLTGRLSGYRPDVVLPVPAACTLRDAARNPKLAAIFAYRSQVRDDPRSYLVSFARKDEPFFSETLVREGEGPWHVAGDLPLDPNADAHRVRTWTFSRDKAGTWQPHQLPLTVGLRRAAPGTSLSLLDDGLGHGYVLTLNSARPSFTLKKMDGPLSAVLQTWALAHEDTAGAPPSVALVVQAGPDGAATFTLWSNAGHAWRLLGQAVDPRPWRQGARWVLDGPGREGPRGSLTMPTVAPGHTPPDAGVWQVGQK